MKNLTQIFNLLTKFQTNAFAILNIFRAYDIYKYTINVIFIKYNTTKKEITMRFRNTRQKDVYIFKIKNNKVYKVMYAILTYMDLLDKIEVISNVSKTKR